MLLDWANQRFQPKEDMKARVLYTDKEIGQIIVGGDDYIVFTSSYIVKDVSHIYYHFLINCADEKCNLVMTRIHYLYEESREDGGYKYKAEEWITDKHGLTKSKDKLARISGKFRKKTIDYKDALFTEVQNFLNNQIVNTLNNETAVAATPVKNTEKEVPAKTTVTPKEAVVSTVPVAVTVEKPAEKSQPATKGNVEELIAKATRMTITAGNDEQFEISKDSWGGYGEMFNKKVAFCLIDTQKTMANMLMTQLQEYTVSFYADGDTSPCVTIKCKKMMQQTLKGSEAKNISPNCDEKKSYNMYVGEIAE